MTTKVTGMMQTSTKGGDISSASPCVIDTDGDYFDVTGTTNFAAFTVAAGRRFTIQFDGALTMTHHATNIDLPGGPNITTAAGDVAEFFATGTNTVQCVNYTKADGTAIAIADNVITLAKMAGGTDGNIISYDASGNPVAIATGSDGQVLTSTGAGSPPAFEAVSAGTDNASCAFYVYLAATENDKTGDGTDYDMSALSWTEVYDIGSDFASGIFTAPVSGKYFLHATITLQGMVSAHDNGTGAIGTSARMYNIFYQDTHLGTRDHHMLASTGVIADMSASDGARLYAKVYGGSKVVDVRGGAGGFTSFGGFLIG